MTDAPTAPDARRRRPSAGGPPGAVAARAAPVRCRRRTVATMPTWSRRPSMGELGLVGWFRQRLGERSIRADRSRSLTGERGGRLDRLDLWFLVVLVLATMTLRTFRLAEPYQMHFDEVYHARTATEFLQSWRYGLSHDIYEWTHPHLAKYAMALGPGAVGRGRRQGHERARACRWSPRSSSRGGSTPSVRDGRAGERLHVATGTRDPDLRPADAGADLDDPGPGRVGAGHRRVVAPAGRRLRRRARGDARPDRDRPGRRRRRRGAGRPGHGRRARGPPVRHRRTARASPSARATTSTSSIPRPARSWRAARTSPGSSASPTAATARRSSPRSATCRTRPRRRRCWPSCSTGTPRTTRPCWRARARPS